MENNPQKIREIASINLTIFFWPGQKIFLPISVIWCAKHPRNTARCSSVCWSLFKFSHHKWISGTSHKLKPNNLGFDFGIYWHGFFTVWFWVQLALIYRKLIFNFTKKKTIFSVELKIRCMHANCKHMYIFIYPTISVTAHTYCDNKRKEILLMKYLKKTMNRYCFYYPF